ncbi:MAG TPA: amino acid permease [Gemmataceae bacterium]|nr:amino acid permease [Gemmataceae bacterium]
MGNGDGGLQRQFGLVQATALNVTTIVGAGVFITIPLMLEKLPGPYALLGWLAAGVLILLDSLVWSELGATLPGSGGTYLYLLECYGRQRWGRLMAFLFIWQFLLSGPLEIASGLIAMDSFSQSLSQQFQEYNRQHTLKIVLWQAEQPQDQMDLTISPARLGCMAIGVLILVLLYRRVEVLGRLTVLLWLGVLGVIAWICIEGFLHFDAGRVFDFGRTKPENLERALGETMILALYSYLGYYNICYIAEEVRDPGRTLPRAILLSAVLVCVLFIALHLAMLGTVPWSEALAGRRLWKDEYSLPADFMGRIHGPWAVRLITLLLIGSCFGSAFAGLLGYSRIPYGAARAGHFFQVVAHVHPRHLIPHVSLLLVGGLTLLWSFFDLQLVITALITTRILVQFVAQIAGPFLLRRTQPERPRPFRIWFAPLPCGLALAGWLYVYAASGRQFIVTSLLTLLAGAVAFLMWSWRLREWPFSRMKA